jgi:hypothetical protein
MSVEGGRILKSETKNERIVYNGRCYYKHPRQKYFYTSNKKNYSKCLHREMWFDAFGKIPKGFDIHHRDGNAFNNTLSNFELKEKNKHQSEHSKKRVKENPQFFIDLQKKGIAVAPEWHKSKEGEEWHRQNAITCGFGHQTYGEKRCEFCSKEFTVRRGQARFCSNNCKSAWRRKNKPDKKAAICPTCGNEFTTLKYLPAKYCSKECKPAPNPYGGIGKKGFLQRHSESL